MIETAIVNNAGTVNPLGDYFIAICAVLYLIVLLYGLWPSEKNLSLSYFSNSDNKPPSSEDKPAEDSPTQNEPCPTCNGRPGVGYTCPDCGLSGPIP
ncbi:MAG: hypothetical protein PHN74_00100 [Candidatus Pacebacteria bacterium]|nr:hypothetical protein [Candidatus Paceibacterota bacterium]